MATAHFPNMFMVLGPNGPFCNLPPAIECQVEWIADAIGYTERQGAVAFEASEAAEVEWGQACKEIAEQTLFAKTASWIFGANSPGKKHTVYFYMGGLNLFRDKIREVAGAGYAGFNLEKPARV